MPTPQEVQQLLNQVKEKKDFERQEAKHKETNTKLDTINESIKSLDLKSDVSEIVNVIKDIKIETPDVTVNVPEIVIPEIKLPDIKVDAPIIPPIKVPTPQVTVNVPEPTVIIKNQEEIKVTEPNWLNKIVNPVVEAIKNKVIDKFVLPRTASEAIPVRLSNGKKFYEVFSNIGTSIAGAVDTDLIEQKLDTANGNLDSLETKQDTTNGHLTDIKENQTNITQVTKIRDSWGDQIGATMIDELMVSEKNRLCGGVFNGTVPDTNFYTSVLSANGTATITNSILDCATTTDSGSSSMVYTNTIGRYIGGNMNHLRGIFRVGDLGVTNNTRQIGCTALSNLADSFYFQLSGTTFSIVANTTGLSQIKIDNGSFNGDSSTYPLTDTFHTWEILFTNKRIQFYIDKFLVHTLTETTFPICGTRHLRPFIRNANTGVGSVTHLYTQALTMLTWGKIKTQPKDVLLQKTGATDVGTLLKYGVGSLHAINISGVINNSVVNIYDGLTAGGTLRYTTGPMSNQTIPLTVPFNDGVQFQTGLFVTITGANCNAQVIYE